MAVVNNAHLDLIILDDLLVHVLQEFDLLLDEALQADRVEWTPGALAVSHQSVEVTEALLKHLEPILSELVVQFTKVGDRANSGQDGVVPDGRGTRPEGGHHGDTFRGAQGTKGLVFEVAALEDYSRTLPTTISSRSAPAIFGTALTICGPLTFKTSPLPFLRAVSPPIMFLQSESMSTQTKG